MENKKLQKLFVELSAVESDLKKLKGIQNNSYADESQIKFILEIQGRKTNVHTEVTSTLSYYVTYLDRRKQTIEHNIERILGRKWWEFWKLT